ncbi:MAG TPA: 50S ribosomal protein L15 [Syntrophales bacterium]|jgi:large subunit ribosomal protein L15|nr:50S ribosomal protein L15 [Syntrophales bacterium]HQG33917.1 50S ribosomal protein L15 [Syntrophales bacterium]HQI34983.1 50S ribosomal protein L15 [Syntrophales bacterium]HRR46796.1 50S ribosomal protein L15 [Syntrophales bacterium]HRU88107.1 50S ribosomal protein L15 [Syntrophales bacterium]
MDLQTLKAPVGAKKKRKRIGRGGARGGTAGKGHKGQNARSGGGSKPGFEGGQMPMARRLPKRGFRNPFRREIITINLEQLRGFAENSVVDVEALLARGLIKKRGDGVKLLGKGEIQYALAVKLDALSRGAKAKIEAAGGSVVEVS